jgi:hypothetical protein
MKHINCEVCLNKPDRKYKWWQQLLIGVAWVTMAPAVAYLYTLTKRSEHSICNYHMAMVVAEYWFIGLVLGWLLL